MISGALIDISIMLPASANIRVKPVASAYSYRVALAGRLDSIDRHALRDAIESRFTLERHVLAMESICNELDQGQL